MHCPADCIVIIPCLNERASIGLIVSGVRRYLPTVLVVDDGSVDGTAVVAERAGAEVIRFSLSQGKGAALQTGWDLACKRGFQWALTMDGDGQHSPSDIPVFLNGLQRSSSELIIGNR